MRGGDWKSVVEGKRVNGCVERGGRGGVKKKKGERTWEGEVGGGWGRCNGSDKMRWTILEWSEVAKRVCSSAGGRRVRGQAM